MIQEAHSTQCSVTAQRGGMGWEVVGEFKGEAPMADSC